MEITGIIKQFSPLITINGRNGQIQKCTIIIETQEQYPESVAVDVLGEKLQQLNSLAQGMQVHCTFNARAKDYNGKLFNSLSLYKIERVQQPQMAPQPAMQQQVQQQNWQAPF